MTSWQPDVPIDDSIATRLLTARFPELQLLELRLLGSGWDNHAYLVNESIVFRIPHRKQGGELMENELQALKLLNQQDLPLLIPEPKFVASPDDRFPYTIAGYALITGDTADKQEWLPTERAMIAGPLGRFLSTLHRVSTDVPFVLGDELKRADLGFRIQKIRQQLSDAPPGVLSLAEELALTPPLSTQPVWVHGDLYSRHLVVDSKKLICGVIDWGDVHIGDPALDIAIAWMFLPPDSWPSFIDAYGGIDADTWRRAQFRALTHWMYLRQYAETRADQSLLRELNFVLQNVMEGRGGD